MRLNSKSLVLLAAMVCSVAAGTRGSLRRRLEMDTQQQLDLAALDLVVSPEAALHSEFLSEAVYEKSRVNSSDTKKEAKASKGRKTPSPSPMFEQPAGGGDQAPAPTNAPTLSRVSLPSAPSGRQPTAQKTKQPTVEKTKNPTVQKTKQPAVQKTKQPTSTKSPTVGKSKGEKLEGSGKTGQPSVSMAPSPSPPTKQEKTKGKTYKGDGSGAGNGKGKNGGGKGKKGGSEVPEDVEEVEEVEDVEDVTTVGKVAGGDSFLGKFNRFYSLLSIMMFLSAALTSFFHPS
jgi:hypothetical protein